MQELNETPFGSGVIVSDTYSKLTKIGNQAQITRTIIISLKPRDLKDAKTRLQKNIIDLQNMDLNSQITKDTSDLNEINNVGLGI